MGTEPLCRISLCRIRSDPWERENSIEYPAWKIFVISKGLDIIHHGSSSRRWQVLSLVFWILHLISRWKLFQVSQGTLRFIAFFKVISEWIIDHRPLPQTEVEECGSDPPQEFYLCFAHLQLSDQIPSWTKVACSLKATYWYQTEISRQPLDWHELWSDKYDT